MKRRGFFRILGSGFLGLGSFAWLLGCGESPISAGNGGERALKPADQADQTSSLVRAMRDKGYYLTAWQTSLGPIADGIYKRSKIQKQAILVPVFETQVELGEGLIYMFQGKSFPMEDPWSRIVEKGDFIVWRKKMRDGKFDSRILSIRL